jgi:hypothetical protein
MLRLQEAVGNHAVSGIVARHAVATTAIDRHTSLELFGDGTAANPGMTLAEFERSTRRQADWFVEPSLTPADRDDLWALLRRTTEGPHILAGAGDLKLSELRGVAAGDWAKLAAFGRGCDAGSDTVRILDPAPYPLARRLELGETLLALEAVIPGPVLRLTVSELQLADLRDHGLMGDLTAYWTSFHPHLQRHYDPGPGARDLEFQQILDLLGGGGIAPFASLLGRIRDLHRFTVLTLQRLVVNFADTSRLRPVDLILHTSHDESSFADASPHFEDLVLHSPNLVLMLEGQDHLATITAAIPVIAQTFGQPDAHGTFRIAQAMIAGHGETRSVELAGDAPPQVHDEHVDYGPEALDLDDPARVADANALLNTLTANLDPATARVVFLGCLVGSNVIPPGTPPAAVPAQIAAHPNLKTATEQAGAAHGLGPGFVQGARASIAPGDPATSFEDAHHNLAIQYPFDPDAFGTANAYVATGHEPAGLLRAAVELAATNPLVAANQLRTRLGHGIDPAHGWYDELTIALVQTALDGVPAGGPIDPQRISDLADLVDNLFLVRWPGSFGITVQHLVGGVNAKPAFAPGLYAKVAATPTFTGTPDADAQAMRLIVEQGWLKLGEAREGPLLAYLDTTPALTAQIVDHNLDTVAIGASSATFFPAAAPATSGRIRLALAWLKHDPANADVRAFLNDQVVAAAGAPPELNLAVRTELGGFSEDEVLRALGRLLPEAPGAGGVALPAANAELRTTGDNRALIEPHVYEATVTADALNVRELPHMGGDVFKVVRAGQHVKVAGFTHNWAGIDVDGKLGFVHRSWITPP